MIMSTFGYRIRYENIKDEIERPLYILTPALPKKVYSYLEEKGGAAQLSEHYGNQNTDNWKWSNKGFAIFDINSAKWPGSKFVFPLFFENEIPAVFMVDDDSVSVMSKKYSDRDYFVDFNALRDLMTTKDDPAIIFSCESGLIAWFVKSDRIYDALDVSDIAYTDIKKPKGYPWRISQSLGKYAKDFEKAKQIAKMKIKNELVKTVVIGKNDTRDSLMKVPMPNLNFNKNEIIKEIETAIKKSGHNSDKLFWTYGYYGEYFTQQQDMYEWWLKSSAIPVKLEGFVDNYFIRYIAKINYSGKLEKIWIETIPDKNYYEKSKPIERYELSSRLSEISQNIRDTYKKNNHKSKDELLSTKSNDWGGVKADKDVLFGIQQSFKNIGWQSLSGNAYTLFSVYNSFGTIELSKQEKEIIKYQIKKKGYYDVFNENEQYTSYLSKLYQGEYPFIIDFFKIDYYDEPLFLVVRPLKPDFKLNKERFYYDTSISLETIKKEMLEYLDKNSLR